MTLGSAACAWLPVALPVNRTTDETFWNLIAEPAAARLNARGMSAVILIRIVLVSDSIVRQGRRACSFRGWRASA
jgi:hypothetical protein